MSLSKTQVFQIHQLKNLGYTNRRIAREMGLSRPTVHKYLMDPCRGPACGWPAKRSRGSALLEPYYPVIERYLGMDAKASAVVICQRLQDRGYTGGLTILRDYLRKLRGEQKKQTPYVIFESAPGEQCQIDWGYFGVLKYGNHCRKLWCFAMEECYSRVLYLEFTHSCNIDVFIACHINAFSFFGGCPGEVVHDNLKTAVIERDGILIRFNERYLDFLRPLHISPHACNLNQPHEKGKVEKGGIHYIRYNFWPLRSFCDIHDVNNQAVAWRDNVANVRLHRTTQERPVDRFKKVKLKPFPKDTLDPREVHFCRVYRDCRVWFDCNRYSVPHWTLGKQVAVKADSRTVSIYYKDHQVARHPRCWEKYVSVYNPGHIKKLLDEKKGALASKQQEYFLSLGPVAQEYLEALNKANLPVKRNIQALLKLKDTYGIAPLISACKTALEHNAPGAEYVENILLQQMSPKTEYAPVVMKQDEYNSLLITEADLAFYDNLAFTDKPQDGKEEEKNE